MVAAAFDHWDTRTGDPNLHTHVVIANKVQGPDGKWRSVDSRALHHAAVAVSELYDDLLADHLAHRLPVRWGWRSRGERRTPGVRDPGAGRPAARPRSPPARATSTRRCAPPWPTSPPRMPDRPAGSRRCGCGSRPPWPPARPRPRTRCRTCWPAGPTGPAGSPAATPPPSPPTHCATGPALLLRHDQVSPATVDRLGALVVDGLLERRSTWTVWNARAEAARATRGLRMASAGDRVALLDRVTTAALARSEPLAPDRPGARGGGVHPPRRDERVHPPRRAPLHRPPPARRRDPPPPGPRNARRTDGARAHRPPARDHPAAARPARRPARCASPRIRCTPSCRRAPPGGWSTCSSARPAPARPPP